MEKELLVNVRLECLRIAERVAPTTVKDSYTGGKDESVILQIASKFEEWLNK